MKRTIKFFSLTLIISCVLLLTSCFPTIKKAESKMEEMGYFSLDPSLYLDSYTNEVEQVFVFVKASNETEALKNMNDATIDKVIVYYFYEYESCEQSYTDRKGAYDRMVELIEENYTAGLMTQEEYEETMANIESNQVERYKKCLMIGTKQAIEDFK